MHTFFVYMSLASSLFGLFYSEHYYKSKCIVVPQGGLIGWDVDIRLHLLHITQSSLQPLRGLSHSEIIFQKAQSHINVTL